MYNAIDALVNAKHVIGSKAHRNIEAQLEEAAITQVKNTHNTLPLTLKAGQHVHIIMPNTANVCALQQALQSISKHTLNYTCSSLPRLCDPQQAHTDINKADVVITAMQRQMKCAVEIGGMDDLKNDPQFSLSNAQQPKALESLLKVAKKQNKNTVFISLRAPYDIAEVRLCACCTASYAYNINHNKNDMCNRPRIYRFSTRTVR